MVEETRNRARVEAKAQLESIVAMVKRMGHCQECDGTDCELTDQEILEGLNICYEPGMKASDEDREEYHDEDKARQAIEEDPLEVSVRSDWHTPGQDGDATEYMILLSTGGPACRIVGDLNDYGEPESAAIEYQDWFTPWERYGAITENEDQALLTYARCFYFG